MLRSLQLSREQSHEMRTHRSVIILVLLQLLFLNELCDGCPRRRSCYARNCVMSSWSGWSWCSATCGYSGWKSRSRRVLSYPSCGGAGCGSTRQSTRCPGTCCPISCSYSWMSWSSCSATCMYGTQKRYSRVWRNPVCGGATCPASPQTQRCGNGRYYTTYY